jgi:hypothetical protein
MGGQPVAEAAVLAVGLVRGPSGMTAIDAPSTQPYTEEILKALNIDRSNPRRLQEVPAEALFDAREKAIAAARMDGSRPMVDGRHFPAAPMTPEGLAGSRGHPVAARHGGHGVDVLPRERPAQLLRDRGSGEGAYQGRVRHGRRGGPSAHGRVPAGRAGPHARRRPHRDRERLPLPGRRSSVAPTPRRMPGRRRSTCTTSPGMRPSTAGSTAPRTPSTSRSPSGTPPRRPR